MKIFKLFSFALSLFFLTACDPGSANLLEGEELGQTSLKDGVYRLSAEASRLEWKTTENDQELRGGLSLRDNAKIEIKDGMPHSGKFLIDLNSIKLNEQRALSDQWIEQLKSKEILDMQNYPYAFFEIREAKSYKGEEAYQWEIVGDLTIKEATIPLTFLANPINAGNSDFKIQARSQIDLSLLGLNKKGPLDLNIELLISGENSI